MRLRQIGTARRTASRRHSLKRLALAACLAAASLIAGASPAAASVTIGQVAPASPPSTCGSPGNAEFIQPSVTSGNSYVVPPMPPASALVITSWSTSAMAADGKTFAMKVWRQVTGLTYTVVGHEGPHTLTSGVLNTFPANVPVKPGDVLGATRGPGPIACVFSAPGETYLFLASSDLADGASGNFGSASNFRVNISAVVAPSNTFTLGAVKRNKKKGTARLSVDVPNPGTLTASGKGAKGASAAEAVISKKVSAPGKVKLVIKAKGKKAKKLRKTGKVKLNTKITYTPTGGDPATQTKKLKLKKR